MTVRQNILTATGTEVPFAFTLLRPLEQGFSGNAAVKSLTDCSPLQMLQFQLVVVHLALMITLLQWHSSSVLLAEAAPEVGECFWWLSHNPALPQVVPGHRMWKTPQYPNRVGR